MVLMATLFYHVTPEISDDTVTIFFWWDSDAQFAKNVYEKNNNNKKKTSSSLSDFSRIAGLGILF